MRECVKVFSHHPFKNGDCVSVDSFVGYGTGLDAHLRVDAAVTILACNRSDDFCPMTFSIRRRSSSISGFCDDR